MRTPNEQFSTYSETQWGAIKSIVAELGIDADKVTWLYDEEGQPVTENGLSLRRLMEQGLEFYGTRERVEAQIPTVNVQIANFIKQRDQIVDVQRLFLAPDSEIHAKVNTVLEHNVRELTARIDLWQEARENRGWLRVEIVRENNSATRIEFRRRAKRSGPEKNARNLGLEVLREHLFWLWLLLGGKPRGTQCVRFLVAAMAPVYATTGAATGKWLDRRKIDKESMKPFVFVLDKQKI